MSLVIFGAFLNNQQNENIISDLIGQKKNVVKITSNVMLHLSYLFYFQFGQFKLNIRIVQIIKLKKKSQMLCIFKQITWIQLQQQQQKTNR